MARITALEFLKSFFKISKQLTVSELRLLYLLITEPKTKEMAQQEIAERLGTHRRTINIGLKKLAGLGYLPDISLPETGDGSTRPVWRPKRGSKVTSHEIKYAYDLVRETILQIYKFRKSKALVVNEDLVIHFLGDIRLHFDLRNDREFIINAIKRAHPSITFYPNLKEEDCDSLRQYEAILLINQEINDARKQDIYYLKRQDLLKLVVGYYNFTEKEVLQLLTQYFPVMVKTRDKFRIPRPHCILKRR